MALGVAVYHVIQGIRRLLEARTLSSHIDLAALDLRLESSRLLVRSGLEATLGVIALIIVMNFFRLRRWSWVALVLWVTTNLTVDLVAYLYADANFISMIVNTIVAFSILQTDVQIIFGIRKAEDAHAF